MAERLIKMNERNPTERIVGIKRVPNTASQSVSLSLQSIEYHFSMFDIQFSECLT